MLPPNFPPVPQQQNQYNYQGYGQGGPAQPPPNGNQRFAPPIQQQQSPGVLHHQPHQPLGVQYPPQYGVPPSVPGVGVGTPGQGPRYPPMPPTVGAGAPNLSARSSQYPPGYQQPQPQQLHQGHQPPAPNAPAMYPPDQQQAQGYGQGQYNPYLQQQQQQQYPNMGGGDPSQLASQMSNLSVTQQGFNRLWGSDQVNLLKQRQILPPQGVKPPELRHTNEFWRDKNAGPDLFRCTLTKIPETKTLLQKSRLPLGILIHPFKDLTQLPVVQCSTIVRCRSCRTYINPFVYFIDNRRWKCNLCFRVNDLPDEFQYDPLTKTYGDPHRRPEILSGTIEFLAPADYMVRPPQAAVYLFLLETTPAAIESGYLKIICDALLDHLNTLPGDSRTQIGFITYDIHSVQFYNLQKANLQMMTVTDVEDLFIPVPEGLLVKLDEYEENVRALLQSLPSVFHFQTITPNTNAHGVGGSCLGAAVQVAQKMLAPTGGRMTIFSHTLPWVGPGSLQIRECKTVSSLAKDLSPATDFYKKLALDCSTNYIAVDCFFTGNNFQDMASVSCISKYSGGCVYRIQHLENPNQKILLENAFIRYITRKIGFEAVMRVRCSRGLSIHTFHGNLFVRSTDLLSLPNCNPDAGFGMQVSIDEDLRDFQNVAFQAALLYTSSKGERRIRVHTLCLPVASNINDVILSADQQCIVGLLAKMGVDRCLTSSLQDAREAFMNAIADVLGAYAQTQNDGGGSLSLLAPNWILQMLPAYIHALTRGAGFRSDLKPTLDDRTDFFNQMKTVPLDQLIQTIYPDMYRIDQVMQTPLQEHEAPEDDQHLYSYLKRNRGEQDEGEEEEEGRGHSPSSSATPTEIPCFPLLQLCSDRIEAMGVYLLDMPDLILVYICRSVSQEFCRDVFGAQNGFGSVIEMNSFPDLDTVASQRIRNFVGFLQAGKPYAVPVRIIREDSRERTAFTSRLVEDRGENQSPSYYEFLQQIKNAMKS